MSGGFNSKAEYEDFVGFLKIALSPIDFLTALEKFAIYNMRQVEVLKGGKETVFRCANCKSTENLEPCTYPKTKATRYVCLDCIGEIECDRAIDESRKEFA